MGIYGLIFFSLREADLYISGPPYFNFVKFPKNSRLIYKTNYFLIMKDIQEIQKCPIFVASFTNIKVCENELVFSCMWNAM